MVFCVAGRVVCQWRAQKLFAPPFVPYSMYLFHEDVYLYPFLYLLNNKLVNISTFS